MEKDFDNTDKKEYLPPILIEYGTVDSITQFGGPGSLFDNTYGFPGYSQTSG